MHGAAGWLRTDDIGDTIAQLDTQLAKVCKHASELISTTLTMAGEQRLMQRKIENRVCVCCASTTMVLAHVGCLCAWHALQCFVWVKQSTRYLLCRKRHLPDDVWPSLKATGRLQAFRLAEKTCPSCAQLKQDLNDALMRLTTWRPVYSQLVLGEGSSPGRGCTGSCRADD